MPLPAPQEEPRCRPQGARARSVCVRVAAPRGGADAARGARPGPARLCRLSLGSRTSRASICPACTTDGSNTELFSGFPTVATTQRSPKTQRNALSPE